MTGHTAKAEPAADVVMVKIDEEDLAGCGWPVPDARIAAILIALHATAPAATGLDIYRDTPMGKGASDLQRSFSVSDAIAISKLGPD